MLKKTLVALAFVLPLDAQAVLWEWTYTGAAFLPSGEKGIQTVSYVWDPDDIVISENVTRCVFGSCRPYRRVAEGPLHVINWRGLVYGSGSGMAFSGDDFGSDPLRVLGGSWSQHIGPLESILTSPERWIPRWVDPDDGISSESMRITFNIHGGEDGWSWNNPSGAPVQFQDRMLTTSLRRLSGSVPEPGTLALLGLAFAGLMWRKRDRRGIAGD